MTPIPALISSLLLLPRMATSYLLVRSLSTFSVPSLEAVIEVRKSHAQTCTWITQAENILTALPLAFPALMMLLRQRPEASK